MADAQIIGPWEVMADRAHCGTLFWKITRRNSAWTGYHYGRETMMTPKGAIRRFYDKTKAEAEAAKRNAAPGVAGIEQPTKENLGS